MSKRTVRKCATSKRVKSKLGLPNLDHSKTPALESLPSPESKRGLPPEFAVLCSVLHRIRMTTTGIAYGICATGRAIPKRRATPSAVLCR